MSSSMLDDAEILNKLAYITNKRDLDWKRESERDLEYRAFGLGVGLHLFKSAEKWFLDVSAEGCRNDVLRESDYPLEFENLVHAVENLHPSSALDVLRREIFDTYYARNRRRK